MEKKLKKLHQCPIKQIEFVQNKQFVDFCKQNLKIEGIFKNKLIVDSLLLVLSEARIKEALKVFLVLSETVMFIGMIVFLIFLQDHLCFR